MTEDQIAIAVCGALAAGLALLGWWLIRQKHWWAVILVFLLIVLLLGAIWFLATFRIKM